jgi:hypothetical protein
MQHYTVFFIIVSALRVSGGFSAHHQELKNCIHSIWYVPGLLAATATYMTRMNVDSQVCPLLFSSQRSCG